MSERSATRVVLDQVDVWWDWFLYRLDGLEDDEYFWEPAARCWTVRQQADGRFSVDPWPDPFWPPPSPAPVTTITWRLVHMIQGPIGRMRKYGLAPTDADTDTDTHSPSLEYEGWPDMGAFDPADCPATAEQAIERLTESFQAWRNAVAALPDDQAWAPLGDAEGIEEMRLGANDPFLNVVQHVNREHIHHGAEVALLRDLWRARQRG